MCRRKISDRSCASQRNCIQRKTSSRELLSQTGESFVPLHPSLCIRCGSRNPLHNLIFLDRYIHKREKKKKERKRERNFPPCSFRRSTTAFPFVPFLLVSFCRIDKRINKPIIITQNITRLTNLFHLFERIRLAPLVFITTRLFYSSSKIAFYPLSDHNCFILLTPLSVLLQRPIITLFYSLHAQHYTSVIHPTTISLSDTHAVVRTHSVE